MLRVKEIACDNVVSQSCMCERVLCGTVVEAGRRAEKQQPHTLGCASRFNLVGCPWTAHADFHTSYEDRVFPVGFAWQALIWGFPNQVLRLQVCVTKMICSQDVRKPHRVKKTRQQPRPKPCLSAELVRSQWSDTLFTCLVEALWISMAPSQRPGPGRLKTRSVCRVNRSTGPPVRSKTWRHHWILMSEQLKIILPSLKQAFWGILHVQTTPTYYIVGYISI